MMDRARRDLGRRIAAAVGLLGSLCSQLALAQAEVITFEDAIGIALERNVELRHARIDTQLDEIEISEARAQFMPELRLEAAGQQSTGRNFNETAGHLVEQTTQSMTLGATSRLSLFNGFRDLANLRRARHVRNAGRFELERIEADVMFEVAEAFLTLIVWQAEARVQRESLAGEVDLEQQIRRYVEAGARAAADLYQQQANVAAARVAVVEMQTSAALAAVELMRLLQLDPAGTYDFPEPTNETRASPVALSGLLERAYAQRPELHALNARAEAVKETARMARAGYWPAVTLDTGFGSDYTDASAVSFGDQLDQQRGSFVSLNVWMPLFDRGAARLASRRADLETLRVDIARDERREAVGLEVRRAYESDRASRERFAAAEAQQGAAQLALQTAQERFKGGAYTLVELSKARADFVAAEGALARARLLLKFQGLVLDYVVGDLDPTRLVR